MYTLPEPGSESASWPAVAWPSLAYVGNLGGVTTLDGARRERTASSPNAAFVTFYDDATGERVELSAITLDNWVAKTANFLTEELDLTADDVVRLRLPAHWLTVVWLAACGAIGACVALGPPDPADDVIVVGPIEAAEPFDGQPVVACSLRPMGAEFVEPLPPGVIDFTAEVRAYGDRFEPSMIQRPTPDTRALEVGGITLTNADVIAQAKAFAAAWGLDPMGRLMVGVSGRIEQLNTALALFAVPIGQFGSVVVVANPDASLEAARIVSEHVTATAALL